MNLAKAFQIEKQLLDDIPLIDSAIDVLALFRYFERTLAQLEEIKVAYRINGPHFVNTHPICRKIAEKLIELTES